MSALDGLVADWHGAGAVVVPADAEHARRVLAANELLCPVVVRVYGAGGELLGGSMLAPGAYVELQAGMDSSEYVAVSCVVPPYPPPPRVGLLRWWRPGAGPEPGRRNEDRRQAAGAYAGA